MAVVHPLPTLLSQALVAFTIELDNEFEHRAPHRTAKGGPRGEPWLASVAMWSNCMRFVGEGGVTARELESLARTRTNLDGMRRWGYVTIEPDPDDPRPRPPKSSWLIRATPKGRRADGIWRPLFGEIESRWRERFGGQQVDDLRAALVRINDQLDEDLPDCLPILGFGLVSLPPVKPQKVRAGTARGEHAEASLLALLARVLNAFAIEFDAGSGVSIAISANCLRVLDERGVRVRDLPRRSGVSKEALAMAIGFLQKRAMVVIESEVGGSPAKVARLTAKGEAARQACARRVDQLEDGWQARYGSEMVDALNASLRALVGEPAAAPSPLVRGLEPYPDGWRASVPRPETLPHFPIVTHRGGYPDGS